MANKTVIISVGDLQLTVLSVTEVNIDEDLDSDIVKTFDEPVSNPSSDGGYTIDINALEARNVDEFKTLKKILKRLKTEEGDLTVKELVKHKSGNFENANYLSGLRITSNKVKYDAEDLTARELSFSATSLKEFVDDEEIQ